MRPLARSTFLVALALQTGGAAAECVDRPSRAIEVEIVGCRPAAIAIEEQVAGTRVWWLRDYVQSIARANPGVLLRVRVRRQRAYRLPESFAPWSEGGDEEELFYTSRDAELCRAFADVGEALFLAEPPCCDRIPPANTACLLRVDELKPVPEWLLPLVVDGERVDAR